MLIFLDIQKFYVTFLFLVFAYCCKWIATISKRHIYFKPIFKPILMAFLGSRNEVGRVPNSQLTIGCQACNLGIVFVCCEVDK